MRFDRGRRATRYMNSSTAAGQSRGRFQLYRPGPTSTSVGLRGRVDSRADDGAARDGREASIVARVALRDFSHAKAFCKSCSDGGEGSGEKTR